MIEKKMDMQQGHWILAKLGKRVLRPGGRELTRKMIDTLNIGAGDDIVEFAPGLGYTARIALSRQPKSYTAVEVNCEAAKETEKHINSPLAKILIANAAETGLPEASVSKVYGEAMLTMQSPKQKMAIIAEAARILKPGGLYGIHEVGLAPDNISDRVKEDIHIALPQNIKANVSPLTKAEWVALLEANGLEPVLIQESPMHLLEKQRMIKDEGLGRFLLIQLRLLTNPNARRRVLEMKRVFRRYDKEMRGIIIVAKKKDDTATSAPTE